MNVVAVTGASGYIGGLVLRAYRRAGWHVVSLGRRPAAVAGHADEHRHFVLGGQVDPDLLCGVDVLLHGAYDLTLTKPADIRRVNVDGSRRLLAAAAGAHVGRSVLVSSMSAYPGSRQIYGQAKLAAEAAALASPGGVAVRLGLVYGEGGGGMAGSLSRLARLPVVPLLASHSYQFTVHEDDAAAGLLALASAAVPTEAIGLAHSERVPFRRILEGFARQVGARPRLVPVPWQPAYAAMRTVEATGLPLPLRADSLLGLARPAPQVPGHQRWAELGVPLRPFTL